MLNMVAKILKDTKERVNLCAGCRASVHTAISNESHSVPPFDISSEINPGTLSSHLALKAFTELPRVGLLSFSFVGM